MVWPMVIGAAISGAAGLLGASKNSKAARDVANAQLEASQPRNVISPLGESRFSAGDNQLQLALSPLLGARQGQLSDIATPLFGLLQDPNFVSSEVERLRGIARPNEDQLRASLRSQIYNRGRLGLGIGGGVTGNMYNPEMAALEEGLARADLGRVDSARNEQQRLLGNLFGLLGQEQEVLKLPLLMGQLSTSTPSSYGAFGAQNLGLQQQMGFNSSLYGEAGKSLGSIFGGLFGGGGKPGYVPPVSNPGDYSLPYF